MKLFVIDEVNAGFLSNKEFGKLRDKIAEMYDGKSPYRVPGSVAEEFNFEVEDECITVHVFELNVERRTVDVVLKALSSINVINDGGHGFFCAFTRN